MYLSFCANIGFSGTNKTDEWRSYRAALCQVFDSIYSEYQLLQSITSCGRELSYYLRSGRSHVESQVQCQYRIRLPSKFQNPSKYVLTSTSLSLKGNRDGGTHY